MVKNGYTWRLNCNFDEIFANNNQSVYYISCFLLNAVNVFGEVSSAFKPGNEDRILILNAYSGSSRWSNDFIIPIYNSYQHKNSPYVVDVEHMGSQFMHLQNAEELLEYEEGLFGKYADNPPKLLILLGSASWGC